MKNLQHLVVAGLLLGVVRTDFDEVYWNIEYIYHEFNDNIYTATQWMDTSVLLPADLDSLRHEYDDLLSSFQCIGHTIYKLNKTFGADYKLECGSDGHIIGK